MQELLTIHWVYKSNGEKCRDFTVFVHFQDDHQSANPPVILVQVAIEAAPALQEEPVAGTSNIPRKDAEAKDATSRKLPE